MTKKRRNEREPREEKKRASGGFGTSVLATAAAFAGTIVGNGLRLFVIAKADNAERESQGLPSDDGLDLTISGVISNTVAATALAHAVARRRPLVAFVIGAGLTAATGDFADRAI